MIRMTLARLPDSNLDSNLRLSGRGVKSTFGSIGAAPGSGGPPWPEGPATLRLKRGFGPKFKYDFGPNFKCDFGSNFK